MAGLKFTTATKERAKLRLALYGPPGSGKTYTSLTLAQAIGKKVAVIDTEHGRASKYADFFKFDVLELASFQPQLYIEAIQAAEAAGYDVLVVDSLSHAWSGKGGLLEQVDEFAKRSPSQNTFVAWKQGTPIQNAMVEAINGCGMHIICTLRSKIHYTMQTNDRGKQEPKRIGMEPIQREGMEYEFDIVGQMNSEHEWLIEKTTCPALVDKVIAKPGAETAKVIMDWLNSGTKAKPHAQASMGPDTAEAKLPTVDTTTGESVEDGDGDFIVVRCEDCKKPIPEEVIIESRDGKKVNRYTRAAWFERTQKTVRGNVCHPCSLDRADALKQQTAEAAA